MAVSSYDLVPTISDNENVPDLSESSDSDEEFQPTKKKNVSKKNVDFDFGFKFIENAAEYNHDTWNDIAKYIKRKGRTKLDDKIKRVRKERKKKQVKSENGQNEEVKEEEGSEEGSGVDSGSEAEASDEELSLSEDELKKDHIRNKEKLYGRKKLAKHSKEDVKDKEVDPDFFEEAPAVEDDNISFYQMNLSRPLLKAIASMNFVHPTPIQAAAIPILLAGRDVCGCAATGTGKTAAYMLPILERLIYKPRTQALTRVLVLVPTRELGVQVYEVTKQLSRFTTVDVGLSVGGLDLKVQEAVLRQQPDVVIATPGRLIDHLRNTPSFTLDSIEILVLDEADRMLDEYFAEQMKEIVRQCSRTRQTLLFSATMTEEVKDLAAVSLTRPVKIFVDSNQNVAFNLRQEFVRIRQQHEGDREAILAALVCRTFHDHTMVFTQTKVQAHRLHVVLGLMGIRVGELHGNLTQPQRLEALRRFKEEEIDVLLATDVAARGLDIFGVKTVINFVMPPTLEHYIHRVGRTARAGRAGVSVSLVGEQERKILREIVKRARNPVKSRIIPLEIISKYSAKLSALEKDVESIIKEEWEERSLQRAENKANRAAKLLKGEQADIPRTWFQTGRQRKEEKDQLRLTSLDETKDKQVQKKGSKGKRNKNRRGNAGSEDDDDDSDAEAAAKKKRKNKPKKETAEDRVQKEMAKVAAFQVRASKRKHKMKKIRTANGSGFGEAFSRDSTQAGPGKRKKSTFDDDLTNTSHKAVKRMRYDANVKQKQNKMKKLGKKVFQPGQKKGKRPMMKR